MFQIRKGLQEEYVYDFQMHMMRFLNQLIEERTPEDVFVEKSNMEARRYFKRKEIDFLGFGTGFDGCYSFTINQLNEIHGLNIPNPYPGYWFADDMTKLLCGDKKTFQPISSLGKLKQGQIVVYKNPSDNDYLHAGITEMTDSGVKVLSQWGQGNAPLLRHPIERVDFYYGTHYWVFDVNTN